LFLTCSYFGQYGHFISKGDTIMSATAETFRTMAGRFAPGQSGNPAGRPKGSRNKATIIAEALLDEATGPVVAKAIDGALSGDGPMLRTVFQAICRKDPGRTIELDLPEGRFGDPVAFLEATMRAVALGEITPQEAALLARVAAVMVQAQRLKLRTEQQKGKTKDVVADPPEEASRSASKGSDARVEEREESSRATPVQPVSRLYSRSHPADACIAPVFSGEARSSISPVDPFGDERKRAA
jgi:hypothetical protein